MTVKEQLKRLLEFNKAKLTAEMVTTLEAAILAVDDSFDGTRQKVQAAIQTALDKENPKTYQYCYVRDMYPATAVYSCNGEMYQVDYAVAADDSVTLGTPVLVELSYVPVEGAVQECNLLGDIVTVTEAADSGTMLIKVIKEGQGASAYYSKAVLKRDAAVLCPDGTQMFINHQTAQEEASQPVGDVNKLAAATVGNAYWDDRGPDGPAVYAKATVFKPFAEALKSMKDHIGVSIRGQGYAKESVIGGVVTREMTKFTGSKSVDFVTRAGAGGKIVEVFESLRAVPVVKEAAPGRDKKEAKKKMALIEVDESELSALRLAVTERDTLKAQNENLNARQREMAARAKAVPVVEAALKASGLPKTAQARLAKRLIDGVVVNEAGVLDVAAFTVEVTEAVTEEKAYFGEIRAEIGAGSGRVDNGIVPVKEEALMDAAKQLDASMGNLFKIKKAS